MLELLFIAYILLIFIFPIPLLSVTLGLGTAWLLYRKVQRLGAQPKDGKKVLALALLFRSINLVLSFFLSLSIAALVHLTIFSFRYLLIFNFIFCLLISARWFDFTHAIFRHYIYKLRPALRNSAPDGESSSFVVFQGWRKNAGSSPAPLYMDAGFLKLDDQAIVLEGAWLNQTLQSNQISRVDKISAEKIRIGLRGALPPHYPEAIIIALKEQFYPFKSRQTRNRLAARILEIAKSGGLAEKNQRVATKETAPLQPGAG